MKALLIMRTGRGEGGKGRGGEGRGRGINRGNPLLFQAEFEPASGCVNKNFISEVTIKNALHLLLSFTNSMIDKHEVL
jgi:hypothetical protein